ncbi:hypothetical protein LF844_13055 [Metapseudomonas lalkuanensis]|uniref:hypothetical protein n=1 Tax=Metapseudomonas lalkuanensis TaxID=2604832 RepID=UPI001CF5D8EA|nr:hypothetical protein [Pseudomonas lalkuanensis]UCP00689.1 hypothetical protein LF844_13055 [Pseudomonas lalkuanensis]
MRKRSLLFLLCLICPLTWGDGRSAGQLSEIISRSQLMCASAMVYFNPAERTPDPRGLNATYEHLNMMETYMVQLGQPEPLVQPLRAMKEVFDTLDRLPRAKRERYPELIQQLLGHQRQLRRAASTAYASAGPNPAAADLWAQSQALATLLLDYQVRLYPLPQKGGLTLTPAQAKELDLTIEQRFETLMARHVEHAEVLSKARASYLFVRPQLQQVASSGSAGSGGPEFYLNRASIDLDELAVAVPTPSP